MGFFDAIPGIKALYPDVQIQDQVFSLYDLDAPAFDITVYRGVNTPADGSLSDSLKESISEVSFEDNAKTFDRLTISFDNRPDDDDHTKILTALEDKIFSEGHILQLSAGYGDALFSIGAGSITKISPDFPSDGTPSFTIEAYDLLHRASRRVPRGGVNYKGFRDSQVASIIAARNGFDIRRADSNTFRNIIRAPQYVDPKTSIKGRVQKRGVNDYIFLKKVADSNGYDVFSKFNPDRQKFELHFRPAIFDKSLDTSQFTYGLGSTAWEDTLLSFTPTLDAHGQGTDYEIFLIKDKSISSVNFEPYKRFRNEEQKDLREHQELKHGRFPNAPKPIFNDGAQVAFKAYGRSFKFPKHKRFVSEFQIRNEIQKFIQRERENFITGRGTLLGNPFVQSRQVNKLLGLTRQFSGDYYFMKVIHRLERAGTYITEFVCRKVIKDTVIQSDPTFNITVVEGRISKLKGE